MTTQTELIAAQEQAKAIVNILGSMLEGRGTSGSNADSRHTLELVETRAKEIIKTAKRLRTDTFAGSGYVARGFEA